MKGEYRLHIIKAINKAFEDKSQFMADDKDGTTYRVTCNDDELILSKDGSQWRIPLNDLDFKCYYNPLTPFTSLSKHISKLFCGHAGRIRNIVNNIKDVSDDIKFNDGWDE